MSISHPATCTTATAWNHFSYTTSPRLTSCPQAAAARAAAAADRQNRRRQLQEHNPEQVCSVARIGVVLNEFAAPLHKAALINVDMSSCSQAAAARAAAAAALQERRRQREEVAPAEVRCRISCALHSPLQCFYRNYLQCFICMGWIVLEIITISGGALHSQAAAARAAAAAARQQRRRELEEAAPGQVRFERCNKATCPPYTSMPPVTAAHRLYGRLHSSLPVSCP